MNYVFVFAIGIGIVAGLRSLLPPAVVAWAAHFGWLNLHGSPLAFMGSTAAVAIFSIFAIGELIADKLPATPKRIGSCRSAKPWSSSTGRYSPLENRTRRFSPCGTPLRSSRKIIYRRGATRWDRRRDRSIRWLRNPETRREQSAHQRHPRGCVRRRSRDRSGLFCCVALMRIVSPG